MELRKLRNILSPCIATTASSLSKLLGKTVRYSLRRVMDIEVSGLEDAVADVAHQEACAVCVRGEGDLRIALLFSLPVLEMKNFAARLLGRETVKRLTPIGRSSIAEAGSVMAGSFLTSLSRTAGLRVQASPAGLGVDILMALLESQVAEIASTANTVSVADAELRVSNSPMKLRFLILLDLERARSRLAMA